MSWMTAMSVSAVQWDRDIDVRWVREGEMAFKCRSVIHEGRYGNGRGAWQSVVPASENVLMYPFPAYPIWSKINKHGDGGKRFSFFPLACLYRRLVE